MKWSKFSIEKTLQNLDPMGIKSNLPDEYEPEAEMIFRYQGRIKETFDYYFWQNAIDSIMVDKIINRLNEAIHTPSNT